MTKQRLKCRVLNGMFSDERVIVFRRRSGEEYSAFVPASKVRGGLDSEGDVAVDVYQDNGVTWVVLPTEYSDNLPVNSEDVVSA